MYDPNYGATDPRRRYGGMGMPGGGNYLRQALGFGDPLAGRPASTPTAAPTVPGTPYLARPPRMPSGAPVGMPRYPATSAAVMPQAPMAPTAPVTVPGSVDFTKNAQGAQTNVPGTDAQGHVKATAAIDQLLQQFMAHGIDLETLLANLRYRASDGDLNHLTESHASEFADTNRYYDQAEQHLAQNLADRGMSDSTAYGVGMGTVAGQRAQGLSGLSEALHGQELQRRDAARDKQMQIQMFMDTLLGELANQKANRKLTKWQVRQGQKDNTGWGDILGSLLGIVGAGAGVAGDLGWKPLATKPPTG